MFSFSVENGLYSLIAIIITGKVVDVILTGFKNLVAYYIISDKFEEISIRIMNELFSGVTSLSGRGMYTKNDRQVLVVILQKRSILALKELVKEIDENAIMFSFNVHEAVGLTKISKENS